MSARRVLRRKDVLAMTGWPVSTLYLKIQQGILPRGTKLDPKGKAVVWFEDDIEALQKRAIEASTIRQVA